MVQIVPCSMASHRASATTSHHLLSGFKNKKLVLLRVVFSIPLGGVILSPVLGLSRELFLPMLVIIQLNCDASSACWFKNK